MENQFKETIIRKPLDLVMTEVRAQLHRYGFQIGGVTDFTPDNANMNMGPSGNSRKVLSVYIPFLYEEMFKVAPFDGIVVPCSITVIDRQGDVALIPFNPIENIAASLPNPSFYDLSASLSKRLESVMTALGQELTQSPDLVTSWT